MPDYPDWIRHTVTVRRGKTGADFALKTDRPVADVHGIELYPDQIINEIGRARLPVIDGFVLPDVDQDVLKLAVVERHGKNGNIGIAFVHGFGLALRAVGESPDAVDTRGLNVARLRYSSLIIGGALAAVGGAYLPLGNLGLFWTQMTAGRGFIAIAVVVFARWDPVRASWGALVFGGAASLQTALQTLEAPIDSEILLMLPYIATIIVLIGVSRQAEFPRAFAVPYSRGDE